jgi:hypothetical protein
MSNGFSLNQMSNNAPPQSAGGGYRPFTNHSNNFRTTLGEGINDNNQLKGLQESTKEDL